ncbi:hypothetical protein [Humisphaera borealis]|uniref:hypothetical protein n=1 Tax=Humisphaera borealis TaxID=2807512 RepID=UPI0019D13616|nr:hypothetical protein [Humisphaera borealis]
MTRVVIVSGAIANKPRSGGEAWVRLSWISGLKRLGFDVYFIEQIAPSACVDDAGNPASFADSVNRQHFTWVTGQAGLAATTALILADPATGRPLTCHGLAWDRVVDLARNAEMLINISGHLTLPDLMPLLRKKLYIDIDPGYTQCWHADPASAFRLAGHDAYFTIGAHVGSTASSIPVDGIQWVPVRQPVVLDDWPIAPAPPVFRFTTVSSWRGAFGPITLGDRTFTLKRMSSASLLGFLTVPAQQESLRWHLRSLSTFIRRIRRTRLGFVMPVGRCSIRKPPRGMFKSSVTTSGVRPPSSPWPRASTSRRTVVGSAIVRFGTSPQAVRRWCKRRAFQPTCQPDVAWCHFETWTRPSMDV